MNSMKMQNGRIMKDKLPRLVSAQYATGDQWRKNFRKNECLVHESRQIGSSQKGDGKRNVDILGIRELKWTGMGEFNSDDHYYIYYCGQESLRRNGVAIMVNKRVRNAVLGCNLKNDRMISVHFQGKPFNITVIQVYAPTSNAKEAEQFYEDLQDLLELTPKKDVLFIIGDWNAKVGSQETTGVTGKFGLGIIMQGPP